MSNIAEIRRTALANEFDFDTYQLPPIDEADREQVFDRVLAAESRVCPSRRRDDYETGAARTPNELEITTGARPVLLTAEHATHRSTGMADYGTYGLSSVVRHDTDSSLIAAIGRQTGDANKDETHPLKDAMKPLLAAGHLSVHGMFSGRVAALDDPRTFNVLFGIGDKPSEATKDFIDKALETAKQLGLRAGVNHPVIQYEKDRVTPKYVDGALKTITFAAKKPGTTRSFSQREATNDDFVAAQIEFSPSVCLLPLDYAYRFRVKQESVGVYLGYTLLQKCVELIA